MLQEKKTAYFANFNVTFGNDNEPLLNYFNSVVYPAFTKNIIRYYKNPNGNLDRYFFENVELVEYEADKFALTGLFIHETRIDVKSIYKDGVVDTDNHYPSAPFSTFVLFLENHRCVLVKNQSTSPDIRSFNTTVKHIFHEHIKKHNEDSPSEDRLPYPYVNIIALPSERSITESLRYVTKISKLTLKFYPLNGEIHTSESFQNLRDQLDVIGSPNGQVVFSSPNNHSKVIQLIRDTDATVEPFAKVKYANGSTGTLSQKNFTQTTQLTIDNRTGYTQKDAINIINAVDDFNELKNTSRENATIYERTLHKIKALFNNILS